MSVSYDFYLKLVLIFLFQFQSYNPSFTQLEIWFRFVFLVLTFLATVRHFSHLVCNIGFC